MKTDYYNRMVEKLSNAYSLDFDDFSLDCCEMSSEMGLAPGGLMRQEIFEDDHGIEAWETSAKSRCFVHLVNSESFQAITGCRPPTEPMTAVQYKNSGIPWYSYWDAEKAAVQGSKVLARLDSVAARKIKEGQMVKEAVINIKKQEVVGLSPGRVREGQF